MGGGFLDLYEITWVGLAQPKKLYLNCYEKGGINVIVEYPELYYT